MKTTNRVCGNQTATALIKGSKAAVTKSNGSGRGGKRPGAGRKPAGESTGHLYEPCAAALAKAMDGATPLQFICAMAALGGPVDAAREALGMSQEAFGEKYGPAIVAWAAR